MNELNKFEYHVRRGVAATKSLLAKLTVGQFLAGQVEDWRCLIIQGFWHTLRRKLLVKALCFDQVLGAKSHDGQKKSAKIQQKELF